MPHDDDSFSSPAAQQPSSPAAQQPSSPAAQQPSSRAVDRISLRNAGIAFVLSVFSLCVASSPAQVTVIYQTTNQDIATAFGSERVAAVNRAIDRVRRSIEIPLANSAAFISINLTFANPCPVTEPNCGAIASTLASRYPVGWSTLRNRLMNTGDGTTGDEFDYYDATPTSSIPFRWASSDIGPRSTSSVLVYYPLAVHLGLNPVQSPIEIKVRPQTATLKWQFWQGRLIPGFESFEGMLVHETMHALSFFSVGDDGYSPASPLGSPPSSISILDVLRFSQNVLPPNITTSIRELRPTVEASFVVRSVGATTPATGAIPASRGKRTGGDGYQTSHLRSTTRLSPPVALGIMDPAASELGLGGVNLAGAAYTKNDWEIIDLMGWDCDPSSITYKITNVLPVQIAPQNMALVRAQNLRFEWQLDSDSTEYMVVIFAGNDPNNGEDIRQLEVASPATSLIVSASDRLSPGLYSWRVVGMNSGGGADTDIRSFVVACYADYNLDGNGNQLDVFDFLNAWFAGNLDADFDGNGVLSSLDIFEFLNAWFMGCA